jgi:adenylate cyclase
MAETRKRAAILAADAAGYNTLAGADEERTLARLRALRSDLFDPIIAVHDGRVVKRTGDGVLNAGCRQIRTEADRARARATVRSTVGMR